MKPTPQTVPITIAKNTYAMSRGSPGAERNRTSEKAPVREIAAVTPTPLARTHIITRIVATRPESIGIAST